MDTRNSNLEQWVWIVGASIFCLLLSPVQHILDEETYLWIATNMSWSRPYDWSMPFPPFHDTGFVFAHPPLFLWWVKLCGDHWWTGLPWLVLWWWSVVQVFQRTQSNWRTGVVVMFGATSMLLPMTRTAMPDLMMSALAIAGLLTFHSTTSLPRTFLGGVLVGLAAWTKYPALIALCAPFFTKASLRQIATFWFGTILVVGIGEVWLWSNHQQWHLFEVIEQSRLVGRSPLSSRAMGLPMRLSLSLLPFVLIRLFRYPVQSLIYVAIGIAIFQGIEGLWFGLGVGLILQILKPTSHVLWRWTIVLVFLGIVVGHNYVAPRYWLLTVPMWWVIMHSEWTQLSMRAIQSIMTVSLLASGSVLYIERLHAQELEAMVMQALEDETLTTFSGEWGMRELAQAKGLTQYQGEGTRLLVSHNSAGWIPSTEDGWLLEKQWKGASTRCRLVSQSESVGYYADSLGVLPIACAWTSKPIEVVEIWKKP